MAITPPDKRIFDTGSLINIQSRMLTQIFIDRGARIGPEHANEETQCREEIVIEMKGIHYTQYIRAKDTLLNGLRDTISIEDRKFSQGIVFFLLLRRGA